MEKSNSNERILIVAPVGGDAHAMAELLTAQRFEAQVCGSLEECCAQLKSGAGAVLLTEEALEVGSSSRFFEALSAQPRWSELPLVILTTGATSQSLELLDLVLPPAGSMTLLERPIGTTTLIHSLEVALNSRRRQYQVRDFLEEQHHNQQQLRQVHEQLRQAHEQLADRARQLENLVELRTAKLAQSNEQLQREICEREEAERAREALRRKLLQAQEEERRRIARELHDQMGQNLTALNLGLKSLLDRNPRSEIRDQVHRLQSLCTQTARDLHRVAVELRPAALDELGLVKAISGLAETWSARCRIDVDLEASQYDSAGISSEIESILYRTVQEALNNVAKHSEATRAAVVLRRTANHLQAIVEDNGRGFQASGPVAASNPNGRLGLLGIQERLGVVGGSLKLESGPVRGATLIVRIPIQGTDEKKEKTK